MQINRVGQKVVCMWPAWAWAAGCASLSRFPLENAVYTVDAFARTAGRDNGVPGIYLAELPGFECECKKIAPSSWPLSAFRPADERHTDISALKDLLTPIPAAPERVDA